MASNINKETVNLLFNKLAKLLCSFFPGMVVLELFFHKGLFSNNVMSFTEFILFVVWCGIFSVPYNFFHPNSVENFMDTFKQLMCKKNNITEEQLDSVLDKDSDFLDDLNEYFELGFIIVKLFLTYIVYKLLLYFSIPSVSIINIPISILQLFISIPVTLLLSYPFGFIYAWFCKKMIVKLLV